MALACGCSFRPGEPLDLDQLKAHYKHTMEAIVIWELLRRPGQPQGDDHIKLSQARIDLLEAIDKLYPEASADG
ncbi:hypothetical protein ES708_01539 [subsurface metagenome]